MPFFLIIAFLFFIGSLVGWSIEVIFRRFFSDANPEKKWINPGFLAGPYLPLYGFSLCILYALANLEKDIDIQNIFVEKITLFAFMAVCVTALEYITGLFCIKVLKIKLWDYSHQWGNIQGIICPVFTFFWAILSALYYFFVHPYVLDSLEWLSNNLAFSFIVGFFFGVFTIDVFYSGKILPTLRKYAQEHQLVIKYEELKATIRGFKEEKSEKARFILAMRSSKPIVEHLRSYSERLKEFAEQNINEIKSKNIRKK